MPAGCRSRNDDRKHQKGGPITSIRWGINASGLARGMTDLRSSTNFPGSYNAVVAGVNTRLARRGRCHEMSATSPERMANCHERMRGSTGDKIKVGFIHPEGPVRAVLRAIGPSVNCVRGEHALSDTTLQLRNKTARSCGGERQLHRIPWQKPELVAWVSSRATTSKTL